MTDEEIIRFLDLRRGSLEERLLEDFTALNETLAEFGLAGVEAELEVTGELRERRMQILGILARHPGNIAEALRQVTPEERAEIERHAGGPEAGVAR